MDNLTILVTGAAGFIASNFCNIATERYPNTTFIGLDKMSYCSSMKNLTSSLSRSNFEFIKGNITSSEDLNIIFNHRAIDYIIHFAAYTHVDNSFENPVKFTKNNVLGTHLLLEHALKHKVKRFVFVSTDEVYGSSNEQSNEQSILEPTNPYSATKAAAEMIVKSYYTSFNLPIVITRSNNIYGPNQYPDKIVPIIVQRINNNEKILVHGNGEQKRSFLYVDDVVDAYLTVLEKGEIGETYNICSKDEFTINELGDMILQRMKPGEDFTDHFIHGEDRKFNDIRYHICSKKIENDLGWKQNITFQEGLRRTINFYSQ